MNITLPISFHMCLCAQKGPSHQDGSFEHPQHMFWWRNMNSFFKLPSVTKKTILTYIIDCKTITVRAITTGFVYISGESVNWQGSSHYTSAAHMHVSISCQVATWVTIMNGCFRACNVIII